MPPQAKVSVEIILRTLKGLQILDESFKLKVERNEICAEAMDRLKKNGIPSTDITRHNLHRRFQLPKSKLLVAFLHQQKPSSVTNNDQHNDNNIEPQNKNSFQKKKVLVVKKWLKLVII